MITDQQKGNMSIRGGEKDDLPFIISTWLKSYRQAGYGVKLIRQDVFFRHFHDLIESILNSAEIYIAAVKDSPSTIVGYLVAGEEVLHYAYVKSPFRRMGIATELLTLLPQSVKEFSCYCDSSAAAGIWRLRPHLVYNPFRLINPGKEPSNENRANRSHSGEFDVTPGFDFRES